MHRRLLGLAVGLSLSTLLTPALGTAQERDPMLGHWARDDGNARARMAPCGDALCMTNTWIRDPASNEKVGHRLVLKVKPTGEGRKAGDAYDPQRNLNMTVEMSVQGDRLNTSGCMVAGIICRSAGWTRIP